MIKHIKTSHQMLYIYSNMLYVKCIYNLHDPDGRSSLTSNVPI